jgi:hypothetical protein
LKSFYRFSTEKPKNVQIAAATVFSLSKPNGRKRLAPQGISGHSINLRNTQKSVMSRTLTLFVRVRILLPLPNMRFAQ